MSNFTTELRNIVNSGVNIFNFDYPLYDPAYKPTLEEKIIKHYFFSEIGFETAGRFIQRLDTKMNEIMPKYNLMYEAVASGIDALQHKKSTIIKEGTIVDDIDRTETSIIDDDTLNTTVVDDDTLNTTVVDDDTLNTTVLDADTTNQVTTVVDSDQTDTITNSQKFSDTPQGRTDLSNIDYLTELTEEDNNVTTALDSTSTSNVAGTQHTTTTVTGTQDTTTTVTGTQDTTTVVTGKKDTTTTTTGAEDQTRTVNETMTTTESDRTQADLLEEFRLKFNDIDMLIIDDLGDLFMLLYD